MIDFGALTQDAGNQLGFPHPPAVMDVSDVAKLNVKTNMGVTTYGYDVVGNLKSSVSDAATPAVTADDLSHGYDYDDLNRLTEVIDKIGNTPVFSQTYVLAGDGQRKSVTEQRGSAVTKISWEYDNDGRLTKETYDIGDDGQNDPGDYIDIYTLDEIADSPTGKGENDLNWEVIGWR